MGFKGETYRIICDRGGTVHNANIDAVEPVSMLHPSRNVNFHEGGRANRGGTSHVNSTALSGTPEINGIFDFFMEDETHYVIKGTDDGKIWKTDTDTIKTGLTADSYPSFEVMDNVLYITNGVNTPMTWDGTTLTDMTDIPSDWSSVFPKQFVKHGRGNSERMWALGFVSGVCYASDSADGDDFSDANVISIPVNTGDGHGIVGGCEYGDELFVFGKQKTFTIDDTNTDTSYWGYDKAPFDGGAAHQRLIIPTPYDIIAMMEDGEIYSVSAAEKYGDYQAASLTRPAFWDRWIEENVNLAQINKFHGIYDPKLRAIRIFFVRAGYTSVDSCMLYYIDRPPAEAWAVHNNDSYDSGFNAVSSALVRVSTGVYKIYTGDYDGFVWELETTNANDNDNGYYKGFKTPNLAFEDPRTDKMYRTGWLICEPTGDYSLSVKVWIDGEVFTTKTISMAGTGGVLDSFTLGTSLLGGQELIASSFEIGQMGKRIQYEFYNSTKNQKFMISQILTDFKFLGKRP